MSIENLHGKRLYNGALDESATIVHVQEVDGQPVYVVLQYDDGTSWDEAIANEPGADCISWTEGGLLSESYDEIGYGPTFKHACDDHVWFPSPDQLWESYGQFKPDLYLRVCRCARCGLSGMSAMEHGIGSMPPSICARCDEAKSDAALRYDVPGYKDCPVCNDCIAGRSDR